MACESRRKTGHCPHSQCPHPLESGYDCVDIIAGYCECGDGCYKGCQFSWPANDKETTEKAVKIFEGYYNAK